MTAFTRTKIALFIDRSSQQWVVRDEEGNFWIVPSTDDGWERRKRLDEPETTPLEPVPGHYKYMLGLPF